MFFCRRSCQTNLCFGYSGNYLNNHSEILFQHQQTYQEEKKEKMNSVFVPLNIEIVQPQSHLKENLKRRREREAKTPSQLGRRSPLRNCEMIEAEESFLDECDLEFMSILSGNPEDSSYSPRRNHVDKEDDMTLDVDDFIIEQERCSCSMFDD